MKLSKSRQASSDFLSEVFQTSIRERVTLCEIKIQFLHSILWLELICNSFESLISYSFTPNDEFNPLFIANLLLPIELEIKTSHSLPLMYTKLFRNICDDILYNLIGYHSKVSIRYHCRGFK